jgi:hypothetical protein
MRETQETQPFPLLAVAKLSDAEMPQDYYQHLKAVSDATGIRLLFVYLSQQRDQTCRPKPRLYKTRWCRW